MKSSLPLLFILQRIISVGLLGIIITSFSYGQTSTISGTIVNTQGDFIRGVNVCLSGDVIACTLTDEDGFYFFDNIPVGSTVTSTPCLDVNPLNGVSTLDLNLILSHLSGANVLSPYDLIAADADNSGTVTVRDWVILRELILNITTDLCVPSWRFVNIDYTFPNPNDPFPFPESTTITVQGPNETLNFIGLKTGDISGNTVVNLAGEDFNCLKFTNDPIVCVEDAQATLSFLLADADIDGYLLDFDAAANAQGFQDISFGPLPSTNFFTIPLPGTKASGVYSGRIVIGGMSPTCSDSPFDFNIKVEDCQIEETVSFFLSDEIVDCGDQVCVSMTTENFMDITSFQYSINYDSSHLNFSGVQGIGLSGFTQNSVYNSSNGVLTVFWADPNTTGVSMPDGASLFEICFNSISNTNHTDLFLFSGIPLPSEVNKGLNAQLVGGSVSIFCMQEVAPPIIQCPAAIEVVATADSCTAYVTLELPMVTSDCDGGFSLTNNYTNSANPTAFFPLGETNVLWTVTDQCGNAADSCSSTIVVVENRNPSALCVDQIVVQPGATITAEEVDAGSVDNCGIDTLMIDKFTFDCMDQGTLVTLTVIDNNGNQNTCFTEIQIEDTIDPTIICKDVVNITSSSSGIVILSPESVIEEVLDNCGIDTLLLSQTEFDCSMLSSNPIPVTVTAFDFSGNTVTCSTNINFEDKISPILTCPRDSSLVVNCGIDSVAVFYVGGEAMDNCGIESFSCFPIAGSKFPIGTTSVTCTASSNTGEMTNCTFDITVTAEECPPITFSIPDISATCGEQVCIPIQVQNFEDIISFIYSINWDPTILQYNSIQQADLPFLSASNFNTNNNSLSVAWADAEAIGKSVADGSTIFEICYDVVATNADVSILEFSGSPNPIEITNSLGEVLSFSFQDGELTIANCACSATSNGPFCINKPFSLSVTTNPNDIAWSWTGPNGFVSDEQNPIINNTTTANSGTYTLVVSHNNDLTSTCTTEVIVEECLPISFIIPESTTSCGGQLCVPIQVNNFEEVVYMQFSMNWDSSILEYEKVQQFNLASLSASNFNENTGSLGLAWTDQNAMGVSVLDGSSIFEVCFLVNAAAATATTIEFSSSPVPIEIIEAAGSELPRDFQNGNININNCACSATSNSPICPNDAINLSVTTNPNDIAWSWTGPDGFATNAQNPTLSNATAANSGTYTLVVSHNNGGTSTCTTEVLVQDTIPPIASCATSVSVTVGPDGLLLTPDDINQNSRDACGEITLSLIPETIDCSLESIGLILVATDPSGNEDRCTSQVFIQDMILPIANCQDLSIALDVDGIASISPAMVDNNSTDNCAVDSLHLDISTFSCEDIGTQAVTLTVFDAKDNSATCMAQVTIEDTISPMLFCPDNIIANAGLNQTGIAVDWSSATAIDNCNFSLSSSHTPNDFFECGTTTVNYQAEDDSGNSVSCSFNIEVNCDFCTPILACPQDTFVFSCANSLPDFTTFPSPSILDNCGMDLTISEPTSVIVQEEDCMVAYELTWNLTNGVDFDTTCTQEVTIIDNEEPTISCPIDITVDCTAIPDTNMAGIPIVMDNCAFTVSFTDTITTEDICNQVVERTWLAMDACGNSSTCIQTISFDDTILPTIENCPEDITVQGILDDEWNCIAMINISTPIAEDNCRVDTFINNFNNTVDASDIYPLGNTTVTWVATDACGNKETCSMNILVQPCDTCLADITAPIAICTTPLTLSLDGQGMATISTAMVDNNSTDNCGIDSLTLDKTNFSCADIGEQQITLTVIDESGNSATCTAQVILEDTAPPMLTCPENILINAGLNESGATVDWQSATAIDNCDSSLSSSHNSGDFFSCGTTTIDYQVEDTSGNMESCSFTIQVNCDFCTPIITCPEDIIIAGCVTDLPDFSALPPPTIVDSCGMSLMFREPLAGILSSDDCMAAYQVQWFISNGTDFDTSCIQIVTVIDQEEPMISCPSNQTVSTDIGECTARVEGIAPTVSDNCQVTNTTFTIAQNGVGLVSGFSNASGAVFQIDISTVTYLATDDCGNTAECSFEVLVVDEEQPSFLDCPSNLTVTAPLNATSTSVLWEEPRPTDNCEVMLDISHNPGDTFPCGITSVVYTVFDQVGNATTCNFEVAVLCDTCTPMIDCPMDTTLIACPEGFSFPNSSPIILDDCGLDIDINTVVEDDTMGFCEKRQLTKWAILYNDTTQICEQVITVKSDTQINIVCPPTTTISCTQLPDTLLTGVPMVRDQCGLTNLTFSDNLLQVPCLSTLTRTWIVSDTCSATSTCIQEIFIEDAMPPMITFCPIDTLVQGMFLEGICAKEITLPIPTILDECSNVTIINDFTNTDDASATYPEGTTLVTWTATDDCGNQTTCTTNVFVQSCETCTPIIQCPEDVTISACPKEAISLELGMPNILDSCEQSIQINLIGLDTLSQTDCSLTLEKIWIVQNSTDFSDTCRQQIQIIDEELPVVTCPPDITIDCTLRADTSITGVPFITDACDEDYFFSLSDNVISSSCPLIFERRWTVTPICSQSTTPLTCEQRITFQDSIPPVLTCPADIEVDGMLDVNNNCSAFVTLPLPAAEDNCSSFEITNDITNQVDASALFSEESTIITWTAVDDCGNASFCSTIVQISSCQDTMMIDTMVVDTVMIDTMVVDTMVVDTVMIDTMVVDTMVVDTMMMDTMMMDTMMIDTMMMDTMMMDTMMMDTMVVDTMMMDTMMMEPFCECNSFTQLTIGQTEVALFPIRCEGQPVTLPCFDSRSGPLTIRGRLNCLGENCIADSITWRIAGPNYSESGMATRNLSELTFSFNPTLTQCDVGQYTISLSGQCGQSSCPCSLQFMIPETCCPTPPMETCCADTTGVATILDAGFSYPEDGGCELSVFANADWDSCYQVTWDWGDGEMDGPFSENTGVVIHTYPMLSNAETYTVCMIVEQMEGDTICKEDSYCEEVFIECLTLRDSLFDLALQNKVITPPPYFVGKKVEFEAAVTNQGEVIAREVEVEYYVPSGYIFNPSDNTDFTDTGGNKIAAYGQIVPTATVTKKITLEIAPTAMASNLTLDAEIVVATGGTDVDSTPGDNEGDPSELTADDAITDIDNGNLQDNDQFEDDFDPAFIELNDNTCCPELENRIINGDFEAGNTDFTSDYLHQPSINKDAILPSNYGVITSTDATIICEQWQIDDHTTDCDSEGNFLVINGEVGQPAGSPNSIWEQTVTGLDTTKSYELCAYFKNLQQCCFDITPIIYVHVDGIAIDTISLDSTSTDPCDWQNINIPIDIEDNSVAISFAVDETSLGDGNDFALDDISLYELANQDVVISIQDQRPDGLPTISASINLMDTVDDTLASETCQYEWTIARVDSIDILNQIIYTDNTTRAVGGASDGWGLTTDFFGYDNTTVIGGTSADFQEGFYYIQLEVFECECFTNEKEAKVVGWRWNAGESLPVDITSFTIKTQILNHK